jgi:hypothetical protein
MPLLLLLAAPLLFAAPATASTDAASAAIATPPTPPPPRACKCTGLRARVVASGTAITRSTAAGMTLRVRLSWTMRCTNGAGRCLGRLTLSPSLAARRLGARVATPRNGAVTCRGPCTRTTTRSQDTFVVAGPSYGRGQRVTAVRSITLRLGRVCATTRAPLVYTIVFTRSGAIDFRRSDLT